MLNPTSSAVLRSLSACSCSCNLDTSCSSATRRSCSACFLLSKLACRIALPLASFAILICRSFFVTSSLWIASSSSPDESTNSDDCWLLLTCTGNMCKSVRSRCHS
uniref:Uncharacterized protein n=1 Tax=Arundo donax TaxID=35708 RepID=A0A0A9I6M7_ARUDO